MTSLLLALVLAGPARAAQFEAVEPPMVSAAAPLTSGPQLPALPASIVEIASQLQPPLAVPVTAAPSAPVAALAQAQFAVPRADQTASRQSSESQSDDFARAFDGLKAAPVMGAGWSVDAFPSAVGGLPTAFKSKDGDSNLPSRVYSGGLALQESFETYFASQKEPQGGQHFLWTRGHPPSVRAPTKNPIEADARDLARLIVIAGRSTNTGKVELALHSYGNLVFQRMLQMRGDEEVDRALALLQESKIFMLNATTHYEGSERKAGREFEQMGQATRQIVDWLDMMDKAAGEWRAAARYNPFIALFLAQWEAQRATVISFASSQAAGMMKKDLEEPWPAYDSIRLSFLEALKHDSQDGGWQESMLRRSSDMFRLEFSKADVSYLRKMKVRLELVHAAGDKLLNWASAQILFERLGIAAPKEAPASGAVLTDKSGNFRAVIVDGDHYFPLKNPAGLAGVLDR